MGRVALEGRIEAGDGEGRMVGRDRRSGRGVKEDVAVANVVGVVRKVIVDGRFL